MNRFRHPRPLLALAGLATTALLLTGCMPNPVEQLREGITEVVGEGVVVDDVTPVGEMPADFPAEVPLIDGTLVSGAGITLNGVKTWTIELRVTDAVEAAFEEVNAALLGAGFEAGFSMVDATSGVGMYETPEFGVMLTVENKAEGTLVSYVVTRS